MSFFLGVPNLFPCGLTVFASGNSSGIVSSARRLGRRLSHLRGDADPGNHGTFPGNPAMPVRQFSGNCDARRQSRRLLRSPGSQTLEPLLHLSLRGWQFHGNCLSSHVLFLVPAVSSGRPWTPPPKGHRVRDVRHPANSLGIAAASMMSPSRLQYQYPPLSEDNFRDACMPSPIPTELPGACTRPDPWSFSVNISSSVIRSSSRSGQFSGNCRCVSSGRARGVRGQKREREPFRIPAPRYDFCFLVCKDTENVLRMQHFREVFDYRSHRFPTALHIVRLSALIMDFM